MSSAIQLYGVESRGSELVTLKEQRTAFLMSTPPVFYDPERKRWKLIRRTIDVVGVTLTILLIFFLVTVLRGTNIPDLPLAEQKKNYRALKEKENKHPRRKGTHRKTTVQPTQLALNSGESLRARRNAGGHHREPLAAARQAP